MKIKLIFTSCLGALTIGTAAFAQTQQKFVAVLWQRLETQTDGRKILVSPPSSYLEALKKCGIAPQLSPMPSHFPIDKILCPGVLNDSTSADLMARATRTVDRLLDYGLKQIATVNLAELRAQMETVLIRISDWGLFESALDAPGTPRRFAVNIEQIRTVILNAPYWKLQEHSEFAEALLVHEILGALGHRDQQYQLTLAIWWLSRHPERIGPLSEELPGFIQKMEPQDFSKISIVGHGGDSNQLIFKASLLALTEKQLAVEVPAKFIPSRERIEALILTSPISSASLRFLAERNLCDTPQGGQSIYYCGGFTLKGATGKPFLLISDSWGGFVDSANQSLLLIKIYQSMVRDLICASGYRCANGAAK